MRNLLLYLIPFLAGGAWNWLWEFIRSLFYERGSRMLTPFFDSITMDGLLRWGPTIGFPALGVWLIWKARHSSPQPPIIRKFKLEPWHLIALGLIIASCGVIWQVYSTPPQQPRAATTLETYPEPLSAEEVRFRQDLRKFVLSNVAEINQSFGYLEGGVSNNIANTLHGQEQESMEAIVNLFHEVMRFGFNARAKPLLDSADMPIETMGVAGIAVKLKGYFGSYRDAQNYLRWFLQLSGTDPNKDDLLTRWLIADSRALEALRDLKSFPQGKMLEEINEGFFPARSGLFASYTKSAK